MPRHRYPGKKLCELKNYFETIVTFEQIVIDPTIDKINKPDYQGSLDEERINSLLEEFKKHPTFLRYKNKIVIGELNNTWYILDGQHRLEMVKLLNNNYEGELHFCWFKFTNENDMRELFNSINKDSTKNQWFINCDDFKQIIITEFNKQLKKYFNTHFAKTKTEKGKLYTIEEFTEKLVKINFFNKENITGLDYYKIIYEKNKEFFNKCNYQGHFRTNKSLFYKDEYKNIEANIIIFFKNNNFIEWLEDNNKRPIHKFKGTKQKISYKLREKVWYNNYKELKTVVCPISFCNETLNYSKKNGWDAGHIISENNGGKTILTNLKPLCKSCNCSMGSKNWNEYDETFLN